MSREVYYARFQQPIPRSENMEPVSEFVLLNGKQRKYVVDKMMYTKGVGLDWWCDGEEDHTDSANVTYVRYKRNDLPTGT